MVFLKFHIETSIYHFLVFAQTPHQCHLHTPSLKAISDPQKRWKPAEKTKTLWPVLTGSCHERVGGSLETGFPRGTNPGNRANCIKQRARLANTLVARKKCKQQHYPEHLAASPWGRAGRVRSRLGLRGAGAGREARRAFCLRALGAPFFSF